jgi:hypothetical protein
VTDEFDDIIDGCQKLFPKPALAEPVGTAIKARHTKRSSRDQFIIVSMAWKDSLDHAVHAATLKIALHLLFTSWQRNERSIPLTNRALPNIPRRSKWNGLTELERLGLVTVERRPRRAPIVTILAGGRRQS